MERQISCEFNIDTACVEVKYAEGSMISIDCTRVENEVARNMYEASKLDLRALQIRTDRTCRLFCRLYLHISKQIPQR